MPCRRKPVPPFFCWRAGGSRSAGRGCGIFPASGKGVTISWGRCEKSHGTLGKNHTFPKVRHEIPAWCAYRSLEDSFRTPEGPLLYRSHPNSHFVHQKGLSCTKVRGLAGDDERRGDGGFLPSRVRRSGSGFLPSGGAGSKSERSPPAGRGKPPERQCRNRTRAEENRLRGIMTVVHIWLKLSDLHKRMYPK